MPTTIRLSIDGVDQSNVLDVRMDQGLNGRSLLQFNMRGSLPDRLDTVLFYKKDLTTVQFGGLIVRREVRGVSQGTVDDLINVECKDFAIYADLRYATLSYTTQVELEDVIDDLADLLAPNGVTYTPVSYGFTLEPFAWVQPIRISDAFRQLGEQTGLVWKISPSKVLTFEVPGDNAGPVNISTATPNSMEVTWNDAGDVPPNSITLVCGIGQRVTSEPQTADGVASSWTTKYPASPDINSVYPNVLYLDGVIQEPISWLDQLFTLGYPDHWTWNWETHTLTSTQYPTPVVPTAGVVIDLPYTIQYPFTVNATTGATPIIERVISRPDILYIEQAQAVADQMLALATAGPKEFEILTRIDNFEPGHLINADLPVIRKISTDVVITEVSLDIEQGTSEWIYRLRAVDVDQYRGSYVDQWRDMLASDVNQYVQVAGSNAGCAPPEDSNQFNRNGYFGGNVAWRFIERHRSIINGHLSGIEAANVESSQCFGYDCHIEDP